MYNYKLMLHKITITSYCTVLECETYDLNNSFIKKFSRLDLDNSLRQQRVQFEEKMTKMKVKYYNKKQRL